MMSLKRVVLIAALVALVSPAAALADGITFGFTGSVVGGTSNVGHMYAVQPNSGGSVIGSVVTNVGYGTTRAVYVSRFSGSTIPTPTAPNNFNPPPQIAPTFGSLAFDYNSFNFGSVLFTTGAANAFSTGTGFGSVTYDAGGSIVITGNGGLSGTGTPLFTGTFTGPTTLTLVGQNTVGSTSCPTCVFWYDLTGPVAGSIDPGLMALLGLTGNPTGRGLFFSFVLGFKGPVDTVGNVEGGTTSVVVPEPGTLALFGTGLVGIAGFIRRRFKV